MSQGRAGTVGVLVAMAGLGGLTGCASTGERLPQCKGRSAPINPAVSAPVAGPERAEIVADGVDDAEGT